MKKQKILEISVSYEERYPIGMVYFVNVTHLPECEEKARAFQHCVHDGARAEQNVRIAIEEMTRVALEEE